MPRKLRGSRGIQLGPEGAMQAECVLWARTEGARRYGPCLKHIYATYGEGKRDRREGAAAKLMGKRAGVCDLVLPTPMFYQFGDGLGAYGALYIELKVWPNKPTPAQEQFMYDIRTCGNYSALVYSVEEFKEVVRRYLEKPHTLPEGFR